MGVGKGWGPFCRRFRTAWNLLVSFGPLVFWEEIWERLGWPRWDSEVSTRQVPTTSGEKQAPVFSVSVVVPVSDGGTDLGALLESLHQQNGCELQVILLDSGDTEVSSEYRYRYPDIDIIRLARADFSHSGTRNLGVSRAHFPLVFLTVQDAVLPGRTWLHRLCSIQANQNLAALSVREVPKEAADLFARFSIATHYRGLGLDGNATVIHERYHGLRRTRIRSAAIGNVACLYSRAHLLVWPFKGSFGEDFLMGIQLLRQGLRVGKSSELAVVHSHNRPPFYWLKRMFASRRLLIEVGLEGPYSIPDEKVVLEGLKAMVLLCGWVRDQEEPFRAINLVISSERVPHCRSPISEILEDLGQNDPGLASWLSSMRLGIPYSPRVPAYFIDALMDVQRDPDFGRMTREVSRDEWFDFFLKVLASKEGWFLASVSATLTWEVPERGKLIAGLASGL